MDFLGPKWGTALTQIVQLNRSSANSSRAWADLFSVALWSINNLRIQKPRVLTILAISLNKAGLGHFQKRACWAEQWNQAFKRAFYTSPNNTPQQHFHWGTKLIAATLVKRHSSLGSPLGSYMQFLEEGNGRVPHQGGQHGALSSDCGGERSCHPALSEGTGLITQHRLNMLSV